MLNGNARPEVLHVRLPALWCCMFAKVKQMQVHATMA
jgi:hypothetical protein